MEKINHELNDNKCCFICGYSDNLENKKIYCLPCGYFKTYNDEIIYCISCFGYSNYNLTNNGFCFSPFACQYNNYAFSPLGCCIFKDNNFLGFLGIYWFCQKNKCNIVTPLCCYFETIKENDLNIFTPLCCCFYKNLKTKIFTPLFCCFENNFTITPLCCCLIKEEKFKEEKFKEEKFKIEKCISCCFYYNLNEEYNNYIKTNFNESFYSPFYCFKTIKIQEKLKFENESDFINNYVLEKGYKTRNHFLVKDMLNNTINKYQGPIVQTMSLDKIKEEMNEKILGESIENYNYADINVLKLVKQF